MNNFYIEILLKSHLLKCDSTKNKTVILLEKLIKYIHTAIAKENLNINISFPDLKQNDFVSFGNKIRLFSNTQKDLETINNILQKFDAINCIICNDVKKINEEDIFGYSAFIKLTNKKLVKMTKNGKYTGLKLDNFKNYIENSYKYPSLNMYSSTNKTFFILSVKRQRLMFSTKNIENNKKSNSYGLSNKNNLIYLPDF